MAQIQVTLESSLVQDLFTSEHGMKLLLEEVLTQVLDAQVTEHIGAEPYERTDQRRTYRNGFRARDLTTRVGTLTLRVPQTRDGSFSTELFQRYQRSEQALVLALMEMVLQGVSTRKVTAITEELCGKSFSKSTVSQLCQQLDTRVKAWRERPLSEKKYPFVVVDALVIKVRRQDQVRSTSALVALGIDENGFREVLGLELGDSESEATWSGFFRALKERGLTGVDLVVSDDHTGLVKACRRSFQGAMWQRCQVHLMRNVLAVTPPGLRSEMAGGLARLFRSQTKKEAHEVFAELSEQFGKKAEKALRVLEEGLEDALQVLVLPEQYQKKLRTTNMAERLNEELRRRERVIRIFPNEASALRMMSALLAEWHEKWVSGKRYFAMEAYHQWKQDQEGVCSSGEIGIAQAA